MIELRWLKKVIGSYQGGDITESKLQYRHQIIKQNGIGIGVPAGWSSWSDVPTIKLPEFSNQVKENEI